MGESGRCRRRVGPTDDLSGDPFLRKVLDWARRQDGLASLLPGPSGRSPRLRPPTDAELLDVCSEFWFEAAHIPPTSRGASCGSSSSAMGP